MKIVINGEMVDIPAGQNGIPTVPLTQAEYDALTDDEKNAEKLYLITDAAASGSDSGGSSEPSLDVYSTEETRIGTWIDGKPLYRKAFTGDGPTSVNVWTLIPNSSISDIDTIVRLYGSLSDSRGVTYTIPVASASSQSSCIVVYNKQYLSTSNLHVGISVDASSPSFLNLQVCVMIEYTKTTDTATRRLTR